MIDGPGPTYATATAVRTAAEVRRAVDLRAVAGADHVKIYTKFTADLLRPLLDEATTLRLPVAAHLGKIDALTAARAGVASLEHMAGVVAAASRDPTAYFRAHDQFLRGWTTEEMGWAALDSGSLARTARALVATHVAIVPTLVVHEMLSRLDNPMLLSREHFVHHEGGHRSEEHTSELQSPCNLVCRLLLEKKKKKKQIRKNAV